MQEKTQLRTEIINNIRSNEQLILDIARLLKLTFRSVDERYLKNNLPLLCRIDVLKLISDTLGMPVEELIETVPNENHLRDN